MRELAQQTQADFENYKKRQMRQQTEHLEQASEGSARGLLPVLDSFELALGALERRGGEASARAWSSSTRSCSAVLEKAGLERMDADGQPFDPNEHEAVMHEDGDGPSDRRAT